jgi:hypothetical protein
MCPRGPSSGCRHLLPASGEKGYAAPARSLERAVNAEFSWRRLSLRPACGEKVAGRPDEGLKRA